MCLRKYEFFTDKEINPHIHMNFSYPEINSMQIWCIKFDVGTHLIQAHSNKYRLIQEKGDYMNVIVISCACKSVDDIPNLCYSKISVNFCFLLVINFLLFFFSILMYVCLSQIIGLFFVGKIKTLFVSKSLE